MVNKPWLPETKTIILMANMGWHWCAEVLTTGFHRDYRESLNCSICWFFGVYAHHGQVKSTNVISLNAEFGRDTP